MLTNQAAGHGFACAGFVAWAARATGGPGRTAAAARRAAQAVGPSAMHGWPQAPRHGTLSTGRVLLLLVHVSWLGRTPGARRSRRDVHRGPAHQLHA